MEHAERLADYLAGELDADEHAALTAQLARDPALRAQLEAMQRADGSLAHLDSPAPPEGFDARLDARLAEELTTIFASSEATSRTADAPAPAGGDAASSAHDPHDELAARRARRQPPRWILATSGAAAALVLVAGGGILLSQLLSQDEQPSADGTMQTFGAESDDGPDEFADDADIPAEEAAPIGPQVTSTGRNLDDDTAATLVTEDAPLELAEVGLSAADAGRVRASYLDAFGARPPTAEHETLEEAEADETPDTDATEDLDAERRLGEHFLDVRGDVSPDDLSDVTRCLEVLLEDSPEAVPVYAELATRDGEAVVAYGLVTRDPGTDTFSRREVWILARDTCEVRYFAQR